MNLLRRSLATAVVALASFSGLWAADPKVGDAFPPLADFTLDGTLPELKGKLVLVDFWASWCGPCRQSFPALQEIYTKYKDQGLVVLGVSLDEDRADMEAFLKKMKIDFPNVRDPKGKLAEKLNIEAIPSSFLISPSGNIVALHSGFGGEASKRALVADITKNLPGK